MRLRLAARRSDLARWQAVQVGRALEQLAEKPGIEFIFKSSLGDQNLDLPLASMGSKGVFTEDFYHDLAGGQCDLVVHSWKDLPVEEREDTHIAMTLPRADVRDVLLVPEGAWESARRNGALEILTSSPRRVHNLSTALPRLVPGRLHLKFLPVRGNVPTRLRKMREEGRALVLAKAGLDRLLQAEHEGFLAQDVSLRSLLSGCRFMVLPVSLNPPAAAQGALAIEVARANTEVNELCRRLLDEKTFTCVRREREILRAHGGGCHQKIGVAVLAREYGVVHALRGVTDDARVLSEWRVESPVPWRKAAARDSVFPLHAKENSWFRRVALPLTGADLSGASGLFVARVDAWPEGYLPQPAQGVWAAGTQTWAKLAEKGVWVNGCQDGLGENEPFGLEWLAAHVKWTKLTHAEAVGGQWPSAIATYQLEAKQDVPDLRGKTHFFWMSRSSFEQALKFFPKEILSGHNACGPGVTYDFLKAQSRLRNPVKVFIGLEQFLRETVP